MPEPAIHASTVFAVSAPWLGLRRAALLALLALTPDLDVLFHVHRSATHSAFLVFLAYLPILALAYRRRMFKDALAGLLAILSHIIMDCFQTYTPILYPLVDKSIWLNFALKAHIASPLPSLSVSFSIMEEPLNFAHFKAMDAPLVTSEGLAISLILFLVPLLASLNLKLRRAFA